MNLINFWSQQIAKWNDELKCGLCWAFHAPLTEAGVTLSQVTEEQKCCVQVFLTRDRVVAFSTTQRYNEQTGLMNGLTCSTGFQLLVVLPSDIGKNNFNEIKSHPTSESKWSEIYSKLEECLSCDVTLDFCEFIGQQYRITTWSAKQEADILDGYSGFRLTVNFQKVF